MRFYFGANNLAAIAAALRSELDLFSRDAQAAAQAWDAAYPRALEHAVRRHLREMGLPLP